MNGVEPDKNLDNEANSGSLSPAETKRRTARRRFLARGAAAGSGLLIVTLHHERSFATIQTNNKYVSSPEQCHSIGGKKIRTVDVPDSVSKKKTVTRVECDVP